MATPTLRSTRPASGETRAFRSDIQALRTLAVMSVMLYHLWPNRLTGGFVGVDIFFVISGYLITSHLVRERAKTGRIALGKFWARRASRLLPASLLVLALVGVATLIWVPNALWPQFFGDITASALYVQNWHLLLGSVDYLAADNLASPVQHFWTLSAEEQFYVLLPLLLVVSMWLFRKLPWRAVMFVAIAVATLASFVFSVAQMNAAPSAAYFSTLTRAWEFGAGALLAFAPAIAGRVRGSVVSGAGIALILVSVFAYSGATPFPGATALLPVAGTVLAIWGGAPSLLADVGRFTPVAMIGRVSYAIYLWHWAFIVIVPFATGVPLTTVHKLAIGAGSIALAWLSTRFVEDTVRTSPRLLGGRRPRTIAVWSAAGMACVLVVSMGSVQLLRASEQRTAEIAANLVNEQPECFGAEAIDPELAPCDNPELAGLPLVPTLSDIESDDGNNPDCWAGPDESEFRVCSFGPKDATHRVLAIGDSHNNAMIPAYRAAAEELGWRFDVAGHAGCYWTEEKLELATADQTAACTAWREAADEYVASADNLDAIVVANRVTAKNDLEGATASDSREDVLSDSAAADEVLPMTKAWAKRPDKSVPIIALRDNPSFPDSPVTCVSEDPETADERCEEPQDTALLNDPKEDAVLVDPDAELIDLTRYYCADGECPAVIGGVVVYRDGHHLTATYASTLGPYLADELQRAIR
ncbi:acyltransferase family protein [Microbacterium sorbitolivorans]|uniref:Acyltransferase n=1 Tax=Microbacterium sorbitolivorans TaxID=1867410 RepID=A0A367XU74_9MICO|nr:acyltransferase family protein [Microbacterium sorbitolivorans]RCK57176.1 acyltransferase [Microbacterium sorbitolivorans]